VYARNQLLEIERLRDVVVCSELQSCQFVFAIGSSRQHNRRNARAVAPFAAQLEPVLAGQHHVEDDQIGRERFGGGDGQSTVADRLHLKSLECQIVIEDARESGVVLQQSRCAASRSAPALARTIVTVVPTPGCLAMDNDPA
jgi:hypothetical protein